MRTKPRGRGRDLAVLVQEAASSDVQVFERWAWNEPDMPTIGAVPARVLLGSGGEIATARIGRADHAHVSPLLVGHLAQYQSCPSAQ